MRKFSYKARTFKGKTVTGIVEAVSKKEALILLHEKNLVVFKLGEKRTGPGLSFLLLFRKISSKELTEFTRQLSTMIKAGLTLTNSLTIIQEQSQSKMTRILSDIIRKIEAGSTFHQALSSHRDVFSKTYISLVKSGETAGKLDQILAQLADNLEKQQAFKRKVQSALLYPSLIIGAMVAVAFIMMVYVVPKLTQMYQEMEAQLPLPTQILINISKFMAAFWYLIILMVLAAFFLFRKWRKTKHGREVSDRFFLHLPLIGKLIGKVVLTQISRTLSMLINAGVPIIESLNIVAEAASNVIFEDSIRLAAKAVEKGLPLTSALEKFEEYPPIVIQMVSVGEQTGKVGEVLGKIATYFEQETEMAIKGLTTAIEPLMMIILGIGVGFIVLSVITPIYNLTSQF